MIWTRRQFVGALASLAAGGRFRWGICSETFEGSSFADACRAARRTGYTGIEVAPFHLSDDPAVIAPGRRTEFRRMMQDAGVDFIGTHALLSAPAGLHLTTPDAALRERSWEYFGRLIDLTADLGENAVMVLGSSKQRAAVDGSSVADAVRRLEEGLARMAPTAASRRVTILLEPLAPHLCNVINTLEEAVAVVKKIGSPAVQSMFDSHNTTAEKLPAGRLIEKYFPYIRHVHLNEMDGRYPGSGDYDFQLVLRALRNLNYQGWLSVEVFDFKPDGETIARRSYAFLRGKEQTL